VADKRITELDPITTVQAGTLLVVVDDPTGTPINKKATVSQVLAVGGGAPSPHHATHEPGGTDLLVNAAWTSQPNIFTVNQSITKVRPELQLQTPGDTTKARLTSVVPGGRVDLTTNLFYNGSTWMRDDVTKSAGLVTLFENGQFGLWRLAAGGTDPAALVQSFIVDNASVATFYGQVRLPSINPTLQFGGTTSAFPALRNTGAVLEVITADTPASLFASLRALNFLSMGAGTNLADLTVTGGTNFTAGLYMSGGNFTGPGSIVVNGSIQAGNYIYPGAVTAPGTIQASWYLGAHSSYGLYSNTGFYLEGGVYCGLIQTRSGGTSLADLTCTGANNFTAGLTVSAGGASITGTTVTNALTVNAGPITCSAYIMCAGVMYPGRIDNGAAQTSWYLASHPSYGLYSNTGLYLAGNFYVAGSSALAALNATNTTVLSLSCNGTCVISSTAARVQSGQLSVQFNADVAQGFTMQNVSGTLGFFQWYLNNAGADYGSIRQVSGGVSFVVSSDRRLKTDHGRATDLTALRQVVIHDFTWKREGVRDRGLFAQEAHPLFPTAIFEGTDELCEDGVSLRHAWGVDYSKLVPHLIVGWQQHEVEIAALRADVAELALRLRRQES
jgi:hypothetical protein